MSSELDHIRRRLADEGEKTATYFEALSPGDWNQQIYQTGSEWGVKEILAHFISAERAYQKYLSVALKGGGGAPGIIGGIGGQGGMFDAVVVVEVLVVAVI